MTHIFYSYFSNIIEGVMHLKHNLRHWVACLLKINFKFYSFNIILKQSLQCLPHQFSLPTKISPLLTSKAILRPPILPPLFFFLKLFSHYSRSQYLTLFSNIIHFWQKIWSGKQFSEPRTLHHRQRDVQVQKYLFIKDFIAPCLQKLTKFFNGINDYKVRGESKL